MSSSFAAGYALLSEDKQSSDDGEDFAFTSLDGNTKHLSDYRGKIIVLDMWATWCQPCHYQMLELKKIYQHYNSTDLEILSIDTYDGETSSDVKNFLNKFEKQATQLNWTFGMEKNSLEKYKGEGIPSLCIFDQQGEVYYKHTGLCFFKEPVPSWGSNIKNPVFLKEKIDQLL
ncbi:MAG: TlpA disulfide reductase family protein [Candidatus Thermoplasmatota archaeon]